MEQPDEAEQVVRPAAPQPQAASPQAVLALQRTAGNAAVVRALSAAPAAQVMRFDAAGGGHQGMEREVAGLDPHGGLAKPDRLKDPDPKAGTREAGVNAVYSGNFMQDFSQINTPTFHKILAEIPKDPVGKPKGQTIGGAGAEAVSSALIRALAILDVGPRLANDVVAGNMQVYRPEQHVDQPMGYSAATDALVRDAKTGTLRKGRATVEGGSKPGSKLPSTAVCTVDTDRDAQLRGSAVPGMQMENPELFKVSPTGLQNHIYNSAEWVKTRWIKAAGLGPTDQGRFQIGAGLHAIEDYFAHSNFIEVGLNSYIDTALKSRGKQSAGVKEFLGDVEAQGRSGQAAAGGGKQPFVDTMFDASVPAPGARGKRRQAVTTGSVGPMDMRASIGHILLPKVPELQSAIDGTVEKLFHLVEDDKVSSWEQFKKLAGEDRPTAAVLALGDGLDKAGMTLPVPDGIDVKWDELQIPILPDIPYPSDVDPTFADLPVTRAIGTYIGFVSDVRGMIAKVRDVLDVLRYVGFIAYPIRKTVGWVLDKLTEMLKTELEQLKQKIKHHLALLIVQLLDTVTGKDTRDEKDRTIGDALEEAHEAVEGLEKQTSLQYRLLPGGDLAGLSAAELEPIVGPVTPSPTGGWVAKNALAPSHSEIAKDHAPHQKHLHTHGGGLPGDDHDAEDGSVFYGIARALAVEADRHVLRQVELMWAGQGSLYGDAVGLDTSKMEVSHDAFGKEASTRAEAEEKRADKQGFRHAQSDAGNKALMDQRPEVRKLLDMVDLIIAHPDDSSWWRPVVDKYVGAHPEEVAHHIKTRNATRGGRRRIGS